VSTHYIEAAQKHPVLDGIDIGFLSSSLKSCGKWAQRQFL